MLSMLRLELHCSAHRVRSLFIYSRRIPEKGSIMAKKKANEEVTKIEEKIIEEQLEETTENESDS